ncbi:hypothetical protein ACRQ1B_27975 [Rhizobium panacihumi]|uniref:hypothetical protein n=1 Tax=Rhizobium panacihumi TaxID=2008450 RepID=UPI003D7BFD49
MSTSITNESELLAETLAWTVGMIAQSNTMDRERIAEAYTEAQQVVAKIPKDNGDARPRIVACFARSDAYRLSMDVACVGWTLTAIEERINERDLPDWRTFRKVIRSSVGLLNSARPTVH